MKNKKVTIILILVAVALIAFLGGFALKDVIAPPKEKECPKQIVDNCIEKEPEIEKGACPLEKFDSNFTLSDTDIEEITNTLKEEGITTVKNLQLAVVSNNGYYFNVKWEDEGSGAFVSIAKVNGKYKTISSPGSGDIAEYVERMNYTLESICK